MFYDNKIYYNVRSLYETNSTENSYINVIQQGDSRIREDDIHFS